MVMVLTMMNQMVIFTLHGDGHYLYSDTDYILIHKYLYFHCPDSMAIMMEKPH